MGNTLMNTKGAAEYLDCTENWIHKLVYSQRIKAYIYDEHGVLIERMPEDKRQGQGLYFYKNDLDKYANSKRRTPGRPMGAKDTKKRVLKSAEKLV